VAARGVAIAGASTPAWDYDVTVQPSLDLDVQATLRGPIGAALRIDDAATSYVAHLEVEEAGVWRAIDIEHEDARLSAACATQCRLRYRFRLHDAAKGIADPDVAIDAGGAIFAPPSTWLVRSSNVPAALYRFRIVTPPSVAFATGVHAARSGRAGTYEAPAQGIEEAAYAAFGPLRRGHVADPGIEWAAAPDVPLRDEVITQWLRGEVQAIADYFGREPSGRAMLFLAPGTSSRIQGKTLGGGGASIFVRLAPRLSAREVQESWVVAHEMVHVAFPDVGRRYSWFSEGLATYVEPIARERAGLLTRERVWTDMIEGLPQGVPGPRDRGLDGTRTWNRVYWGGALFFFLADVRIRERTSNTRGLEDALRAVVATGGDVTTLWPLQRLIEIGDRATGTNVLAELHDELGRGSSAVDLDALLKRLGVSLDRHTVRFDDAAPLASIRDAILPRSSPARPASGAHSLSNDAGFTRMFSYVASSTSPAGAPRGFDTWDALQ
jgi:hypothetical protein